MLGHDVRPVEPKYPRNVCSVCQEPMLGSHYHESAEPDDTWEPYDYVCCADNANCSHTCDEDDPCSLCTGRGPCGVPVKVSR
jgi:hypothetical protein